MFRNRAFGTAISTIRDITYREYLTILAPIMINFSLSVSSDNFFADLGDARRLKKLPTLQAKASNSRRP